MKKQIETNLPLFDFEAGKAAKAEGMARVEQAAEPEWKLAAYEAVLSVALEKQYLTSDDVVARMPVGVATHEWRALGPVMLKAARNGIIKKAPLPPINSARASLHCSPRTVWRSLI